MIATTLRTLPVLALIVLSSMSPGHAESLTAPATFSKLKVLGFPTALLSKIHVGNLSHYVNFNEDTAALNDFETRSFFGHRVLEGFGVEDTTFTFYEFPSTAVRDVELAKRTAQDTDAANNSYHDIYYYLDPISAKAYRAERWFLLPMVD